MNLPLCVILYSFLVSSTFIVVAGENVKSKINFLRKEKKDLYADDEDFDGSGEPTPEIESSGSGGGPDDDDDTKSTLGNKNKEIVTPISPPKIPSSPVPSTTTEIPFKIETKTQTSTPTKINSEITDHTDRGSGTDDTSKNEHTGVYIVNSDRDRTTSFFAQPGILAAVIGGAVVGLLCAILVVMFIVYRMRKKDEGSYALEEMKRSPATNPYMKPNHREFFA